MHCIPWAKDRSGLLGSEERTSAKAQKKSKIRALTHVKRVFQQAEQSPEPGYLSGKTAEN